VLTGQGFVGVATSKKLGGKPARNLQKRRVKEILQGSHNPSVDLVVVISERAKSASFEQLRADIQSQLERISWESANASESS
jgi:ribonuclease P protein component